MNSEENRKTLSLGGGKYILATKMRGGGEVTDEVLTRAGRFHEVKENLLAKEVFVGDGEGRRRYVVCFNREEAKRQDRHREKLLGLLAAELETLKSPGDKSHSKRACELLSSARFGRYIRKTKRGKLKVDRAAVAREATFDGKWVITTNDDTLSVDDLVLGYKQLMRVEECWRTMKSGLKTRPMFSTGARTASRRMSLFACWHSSWSESRRSEPATPGGTSARSSRASRSSSTCVTTFASDKPQRSAPSSRPYSSASASRLRLGCTRSPTALPRTRPPGNSNGRVA